MSGIPRMPRETVMTVVFQGSPHGCDGSAALTVRGKSHPWPFSTWATPENAKGCRGCQAPLPAAADYFHSLLTAEVCLIAVSLAKITSLAEHLKICEIVAPAKRARDDVINVER